MPVSTSARSGTATTWPVRVGDVELKPGRNGPLWQPFREREGEFGRRAVRVLPGDHIPLLDLVGGYVHPPSVYGEMPVVHQVSSLTPRVNERQPVDDVVQPGLEELEQAIAGDAGALPGHLEILPELALQDPVGPPGLLFLL